jgi:hypothetical protein
MDQTREADGATTTSSGAAHRLAALRGELWERHATLRTLNPDDDEYADATARVLDLTSQLLGLEAEAAAGAHRSGRRARHIGFAVVGLLLAAAVALAVAAAALAVPAATVAAGAALLLAALAFGVTWWVRRRGAVRIAPADRSAAGRPVPVPDTEPGTEPTPS